MATNTISMTLPFGGNSSNLGLITDLERRKKSQAFAEALLKEAMDTKPIQSHWQGAAKLAQALMGGLVSAKETSADQADRQQAAQFMMSMFPGASPSTTSSVSQTASEASPGDMAKSPDKQSFLDTMTPLAQQASQQTGVDPRIIAAQAALETGWGKSAPGNNYFGIKSHGKPGGQSLATTEVVNGAPVRMNDSFRSYSGPEESAQDYANFINQNPRYRGLKNAQGMDAQIAQLQGSGYATDPNYGAKVASIARTLPFGPNASAGAPMPQGGQPPMPAQMPQQMGGPMQPPPPPVQQQQPMQMAQAPMQQAPVQGQPFAGMTREKAMELYRNPYTRPIVQSLIAKQLSPQDLKSIDLGNEVGFYDAKGNIVRRSPKQISPKSVDLGDKIGIMDGKGNIVSEVPKSVSTNDVRNYNLYVEQTTARGEQPKPFQQYALEMKTAGRPLNIGSIPPGYQMAQKPDGSMSLAPIPGGPIDKAEEEKKTAKEQSTTIVTDDIGRAMRAANGLTTGVVGALSSSIPGTPAYDLSKILDGVRANVGFDRLQQMRNSSPTGGALGQVSEQENKLLQSVIGSLEQSQSKDQLMYNLRRLHNVYTDAIHGSPEKMDAAVKAGKITRAQMEKVLSQRYDLSQAEAEINQPGAVRRYNPATGKIE